MRRIEEVMGSESPISVEPRTTMGDAALLMSERDVSHLLVLDGDVLLGVLCACDLERAARSAEVTVCMSAPAIAVEAGSSAFDAARSMIERGVSCLPVVREGCVVGVVTANDLRRSGVLPHAPERCTACGSSDHVRSASGVPGVAFCMECTCRSAPPGWNEDTGVAG
jgi:signal-transduction protein with cAMP-binding, CBS, and nucleotidyltransferase domain